MYDCAIELRFRKRVSILMLHISHVVNGKIINTKFIKPKLQVGTNQKHQGFLMNL